MADVLSEAEDAVADALAAGQDAPAAEVAVHLPAGEVDHALAAPIVPGGVASGRSCDSDEIGREPLGNRSVDILARVRSSRAKDYVREFNTALASWRHEPTVREFIHRTRKELGVAA